MHRERCRLETLKCSWFGKWFALLLEIGGDVFGDAFKARFGPSNVNATSPGPVCGRDPPHLSCCFSGSAGFLFVKIRHKLPLRRLVVCFPIVINTWTVFAKVLTQVVCGLQMFWCTCLAKCRNMKYDLLPFFVCWPLVFSTYLLICSANHNYLIPLIIV